MSHQLVDLSDRTIAQAKRQLKGDLTRCVASVSPEAAREAATRGLTLLDVVSLATKYGAVPVSTLPPSDEVSSDVQSPTPDA